MQRRTRLRKTGLALPASAARGAEGTTGLTSPARGRRHDRFGAQDGGHDPLDLADLQERWTERYDWERGLQYRFAEGTRAEV